MSPAAPVAPIRLRSEAGRALVGLWLVVVSLLAAQPLYRWLDVRFPDRPVYELASGVVLAAVGCAGLGAMATAGLRALTAAIAAAGTGTARAR